MANAGTFLASLDGLTAQCGTQNASGFHDGATCGCQPTGGPGSPSPGGPGGPGGPRKPMSPYAGEKTPISKRNDQAPSEINLMIHSIRLITVYADSRGDMETIPRKMGCQGVPGHGHTQRQFGDAD